MKFFPLMVWWIFILTLSGCGTSSKVDKFLTHYGDEQVIQKPIENYSGSYDSVSEKLLLEGMENVSSDGKYGQYVTYDAEILKNALENEKKVVVVIVDETCDMCKELDQDMSTSLSRIPSDVVVMKMNFAQGQALYGVKEVNSVVYLNTDGSIRYISDGGIQSIDNLLYYLS